MSKTIAELLRKELGLEDNQSEWVGRDGNKYKFVNSRIIRCYKEDIGHEVYLNEDLEHLKPRWVPKQNELYYYIDNFQGQMNVFGRSMENTIYDKGRGEYNNIFKTEEEALEVLDKILEVFKNE